MAIKPIKSAEDHEMALREIERLWGSAEGSRNGELLDVWLALVEAYERVNHPISPPDPIAAIRFRMEQTGLTPADLTGLIGSRTRVYEVLRGGRPLSLAMIRRLHSELGIPAEVLIQPTGKKRRRAA